MTVFAPVRAVIAALGLAALSSAVVAQAPHGVPPPVSTPQPAIKSAPPEPLASMEAFNAVEGWVRNWEVPDAPVVPNGLENVGGCAVTLRAEHRIVGRGISYDTGHQGIVNATKAAMDDAAIRTRVVRDATELDQRRAIAKDYAISLELAGARTPLDAATFNEVDALLQPGLDGVAVTVGGKNAGMFPAEMMITNLPPSDAVIAAVSEASGDPALAVKIDAKGQPGELRKDGKVVFQKFRVTHVAQSDAQRGASVMFRGGRVVQGKDITTESMSLFADKLATHLEARVDWREADLPMKATVMPFQARKEAGRANAVERLMATAALAKHVARRGNGPYDTDLVSVLRLHAAAARDATRGPVEAAAWMIAAREVNALPKLSLRDAEGKLVQLQSTDPDAAAKLEQQIAVPAELQANIGARLASGYDVDTGWSDEVPPGARSFIAYALVVEAIELGLQPDEATLRRNKAEKAVRSIFADTPPAKLAGQMPWLGLAELRLADKDVPAAVALLGVRDLIWKHQLTSEDSAGEADDLIGGIVFTSSANPLPTAQSVRPVLLLAAMARDRRITTDAEAWRELSRLLSAVRFLRQLTVDEWSGYAAVEPDLALWGVRSSLWDQRQPIEATALTLWAVCEVLDTVDELGKR